MDQKSEAAMAVPDISVLIPIYNEIDGIDRCYAEVKQTLEAGELLFELVFVDDGSVDGSAAKLAAIAECDPRVTFIKLRYNLGQQRAMFAAFPYCRGRAVITYDSDLQFHPDCLPTLAKNVLDGRDIVGGIRVQRKDHIFLNRVPSFIGRHLINRALRIRLQDFGGVKAYSQRLVRTLIEMRPSYIVIPAMAYSISRNAIEIPVRHEPRLTGRSKWSVLSRMELYLDVFTLYARRPFSWMLLAGVGSLFLSIGLAFGILLYKLLISPDFGGLIIFFDVFLFVTGIYLFSMSLIGEFVVRGVRAGSSRRDQVVESVASPHFQRTPHALPGEASAAAPLAER